MATSCLPIVCSTTCADELPEVLFDICNPEVHFGQIAKVYMTNIGNPLTDENDAAEWATRFALLVVNPARIIELSVIGDKPAAESNVIDISRGRKVSGLKNHTINVRIDETNATNYEMMRKYECGRGILFWYETFEGLLYGGNVGLEGSFLMNHIIPESAQELETFSGSLTWKAKFHPCRTVSPIA